MKKSFILAFLLYNSFFFAQDITGGWTGTLKIQGTELPLVFNFTKIPTGYSATMDSPKQGAKDIPVSEMTFINNTLTVAVKVAGVKYSGILKGENEIVGTFSQGAFSAPMNLSKGIVELNRPQEHKKPYPYHSEDVSFRNSKENIQLAGTITLPKKEGKFPAVILISGSGQQNRNSEILGHKSFLVISDYLTRNGIAVLRYDDRGVGESKGDPSLSTSADFANDAAAAIEYLKTRKEINTKNIGIIGHSEGGMIAPMLAAKDKNIAFLVLLAGTGVAGDVLLVDQNYNVGKQAGMTESQLEEAKVTNQTLYNIIKVDSDLSKIKENLTAFLQLTVDKSPESARPSKEETATSIKNEVNSMTIPWLRYFISYDPAQNLKKVKCPVLVLNGEKDIQVSADLNTKAIEKTLKESGNKKVTVKIFPGLNHLFQHCTTCTVAEYGELEETFSPEVLKTMSDWIQQQVK